MDEAGIEARRQILRRFSVVTAAAFTLPWSFRGQVMHPSPQPMASPNAPMNQNVPGGLDGAGLAHQSAPGTISPLMWAEIKSDSDKLLQMATDFKAKVDQTNLTATLSLPLIKEAHQIEKMAKEIQQRMRA
ncbi:hypothetical protein HNQ77_004144 [Silvibacterium bohemicum]|uniref:Uncharacterized protein n=1 Tax=Silvibacterium bohemicum TaxID=1577686 RepID=A0A841JXU9_9BACT|nr:hypothetical protein [Silvibacterium bohemicum]MBB6146172.1 hypothetical protein [Silvibacterium bohemicum]